MHATSYCLCTSCIIVCFDASIDGWYCYYQLTLLILCDLLSSNDQPLCPQNHVIYNNLHYHNSKFVAVYWLLSSPLHHPTRDLQKAKPVEQTVTIFTNT